MKLTELETLVKGDYSHSDMKEETYECQHFGKTFTKSRVIPKLVHYSSSSSGCIVHRQSVAYVRHVRARCQRTSILYWDGGVG